MHNKKTKQINKNKTLANHRCTCISLSKHAKKLIQCQQWLLFHHWQHLPTLQSELKRQTHHKQSLKDSLAKCVSIGKALQRQRDLCNCISIKLDSKLYCRTEMLLPFGPSFYRRTLALEMQRREMWKDSNDKKQYFLDDQGQVNQTLS